MDVCLGISMEKLRQRHDKWRRYAYRTTGPKITYSIEKIQPKMMVAMFNVNFSTTIISYYSPNNVNEETDLITFYNELSYFASSIPKHNILIIGGGMDSQIVKNVSPKFCLHNLSNRNKNI